jgi:hypothetical protein
VNALRWVGIHGPCCARRSICLKISSDSNPVDAAGLGPALQSVPIEAPHRVDRALPAGAVNAANLTALSSS